MTITGNKQATNKKDPSKNIIYIKRESNHNHITQRMQKLISLTKSVQGALTYFLLKTVQGKNTSRRS